MSQIPPWIPQEIIEENIRARVMEWKLSLPRGKFRAKFNRERMLIKALIMKTSPRKPSAKKQTQSPKQTDSTGSVD